MAFRFWYDEAEGLVNTDRVVSSLIAEVGGFTGVPGHYFARALGTSGVEIVSNVSNSSILDFPFTYYCDQQGVRLGTTQTEVVDALNAILAERPQDAVTLRRRYAIYGQSIGQPLSILVPERSFGDAIANNHLYTYTNAGDRNTEHETDESQWAAGLWNTAGSYIDMQHVNPREVLYVSLSFFGEAVRTSAGINMRVTWTNPDDMNAIIRQRTFGSVTVNTGEPDDVIYPFVTGLLHKEDTSQFENARVQFQYYVTSRANVRLRARSLEITGDMA